MIDSSSADRTEEKVSLIKRLLFVYEPTSYFEYFRNLYDCSPDIELVGDITPSYSILDKDAFIYIKHGLNQQGFQVKVVFLMRDPVERIWSAQRMRRRHTTSSGMNINRNIETSLIRSLGNNGSRLRTDYPRTISTLEEVFDGDDIFYGFFEELFNQSTFKRFELFLGVKLSPPNFKDVVNASPKVSGISDGVKRQIAVSYRDVYMFVNQRFSGEAERLWGKNLRLSHSGF